MILVLGFLCFMALFNHLTVIRLENARPLRNKRKISVLIPLRNESERVSELISSVTKVMSDTVEVLLLDDESIDDTWIKLQEASSIGIRILQGKPLPEGWVGKSWACTQLAEEASGEIFLFCDADVSMTDKAVERTVSLMEEYKGHALTALPYQQLSTPFEKAIIPFVMHLPILGLVPLRWISRFKNPHLVVANGQWFAISKEAYHKVGGHRTVANSLLEDMELGRNLVKEGFTLLPVLATQDIKVRMYDSWQALSEGFTKNLYLLSGGKSLGVATVFGVGLWIYLGPFIEALWEKPGAGGALLLLVLFRSLTALTFRVPFESVFLHPLGAFGFLFLLGKSWVAHLKNQVSWRGRLIQSAN